jgi:adenine/guanine phosphoribosyltransferase-like PRPP-binding protein
VAREPPLKGVIMPIFDKETIKQLQQQIRTIPDFPIEGIMFRDITPLLNSGEYLNKITDMFVQICNHNNWTPDYIVGPEARGFIFGPMLAAELGAGFHSCQKTRKITILNYTNRIFFRIRLQYFRDARRRDISGGQNNNY